MLEDGLNTQTTVEQTALEQRLIRFYQEVAEQPPSFRADCLHLLRDAHAKYLYGGLGQLPAGYAALDAGRPWICYWILHSLALLKAPLQTRVSSTDVSGFLSRCQAASGGFGGGPHQLPHLAPTYAAVSSLVTLGSQEALLAINKPAMQTFLLRMCVPPAQGGGFTVCEGGEVDVRGCYTALAVAYMLQLDVARLVNASGMVEYVRRCQTYEGGLGGEPGNEAHGGYTYCGLAALVLAGRVDVLDLPRLLHWCVWRQGNLEGGFMGRTNKLVDGCYSFWQGGVFPLLQRIQPELQRQQGVPRAVGQTHPHVAGQQLTVPELPTARAVRPAQQAQNNVAQCKAKADALIKEAVAAEAQAAGASAGDRARLHAAAVQVVGQAADAQQAVERALDHVEVVAVSAPALLPEQSCRHNKGAEGAGSEATQGTAANTAPSADPGSSKDAAKGSADGTAAGHASVSSAVEAPAQAEAPSTSPIGGSSGPIRALYNVQALQLWLLKCCQLGKGGLRDKPGKPADYYHTCYCLSGLSQAQHYGQAVLGPADNLLERTDPLINIVDHKLAAAREFFLQH